MRPLIPRQRDRRSDGGFSLIELLTVIAVMSVLGTLVTSLVISTLRSSSGTRARLADVDNVRVAMDSMTRTLRTAIAPAQLGATCAPSCDAAFTTFDPSTPAGLAKPLAPCGVTFYANFGSAAAGQVDRPVKMTYVLKPKGDGAIADLIERRQKPDGSSGIATSWTGPVTERVLINGIAFDPAVFGTGTGCTSGTPTAPLFRYTDSSGAATADVSRVHAIDINLPVRTPNALHNATTSASTRIFLPNAAWGN